MGRPIQKRKIGLGSYRIEVSSARFTGDGAAISGSVSNPLYIDRQRGSLQFLVKNKDGSKSEKLKLVGKATPGEGEFMIRVTIDDTADGNLDDSSVRYVTKLHNRTVSVQEDDDASTMIHLPYFISETGDEGLVAGMDGVALAVIDVQK